MIDSDQYSMHNFKQALMAVIEDPNFIPPENFMDLNLKSLETMMGSVPFKLAVEFAVEEAKEVLCFMENIFYLERVQGKALKVIEKFYKSDSNSYNSWFTDLSSIDQKNMRDARGTFFTSTYTSNPREKKFNSRYSFVAAKTAAHAIANAISPKIVDLARAVHYAREARNRFWKDEKAYADVMTTTLEDQLKRFFEIMRKHYNHDALDVINVSNSTEEVENNVND